MLHLAVPHCAVSHSAVLHFADCCVVLYNLFCFAMFVVLSCSVTFHLYYVLFDYVLSSIDFVLLIIISI